MTNISLESLWETSVKNSEFLEGFRPCRAQDAVDEHRIEITNFLVLDRKCHFITKKRR